jgi:hypothetical protein
MSHAFALHLLYTLNGDCAGISHGVPFSNSSLHNLHNSEATSFRVIDEKNKIHHSQGRKEEMKLCTYCKK